MTITLLQLLNKASEGYGDGIMSAMYDQNTGKPLSPSKQIKQGDGLAMFVVNELADTYSEDSTDEEIVSEAIRLIDSAMRELRSTQRAIDMLRKGK